MSEAYETLRGRTNFKLRAFARHDKNNAKSFRERVRQRSVHQVRSGIAPESSGSVPGPTWGGFWPVPRRSWLAPGAPRSVPGPFFGVPDSSGARPGASPKRLRAPKTAQDRCCIDFSSIWAPLSSIFERFFVEFRSSRLRRRHKIRISKRSRVILTARLGSCVVQSLRIARTSLETTFGHYMLSLISLRTHTPT